MSDAVIPSAPPPPYSYAGDEIVPSAPPTELPPPYAFTEREAQQRCKNTQEAQQRLQSLHDVQQVIKSIDETQSKPKTKRGGVRVRVSYTDELDGTQKKPKHKRDELDEFLHLVSVCNEVNSKLYFVMAPIESGAGRMVVDHYRNKKALYDVHDMPIVGSCPPQITRHVRIEQSLFKRLLRTKFEWRRYTAWV